VLIEYTEAKIDDSSNPLKFIKPPSLVKSLSNRYLLYIHPELVAIFTDVTLKIGRNISKCNLASYIFEFCSALIEVVTRSFEVKGIKILPFSAVPVNFLIPTLPNNSNKKPFLGFNL